MLNQALTSSESNSTLYVFVMDAPGWWLWPPPQSFVASGSVTHSPATSSNALWGQQGALSLPLVDQQQVASGYLSPDPMLLSGYSSQVHPPPPHPVIPP